MSDLILNIEQPEIYNSLLRDIKSILENGLTKAYKAVDNIKVQTYWQVGERIVRDEIQFQRADYGQQIIKQLATDLDLHERTMYRILKFYKTYPILTTVLSELTWSHYLELIDIEKQDERQFYEVFAVKESWSVRVLQEKIKRNEFNNFKDKGITTKYTIQQLPKPDEVFKNTYNWNFIKLDEKHSEMELEKALLDNIQNVLLEFGNGFAFLGRQQKININNQWHKIDLLFYHILLKCHIIVELKARKLQDSDITQVTRYLTYFREHKINGDRDPIALIICKSYDKIDVYYSAGKDRDDIFVAEYRTKLPNENEIIEKLVK